MNAAPVTRAKYPRSFIAGPYGHPFHAMAVIVPIGAWVSAVAFDVIGLVSGDVEIYAVGARLLILIGLIGAAVASVLGVIDWSSIPKGTPARSTGIAHMILNLVAMALFAGSLALRWNTDELPTLAVVAGGAGLVILSASGWLGGKLAHTFGVRVATEATQREGLERLP
ncbi:DUF2231 domain-containing protein [Microbacterium radiodurans]|uniref:DUF2231 domain-containing protein n=1 Tax=Microbacterium radiodurans TaxID=661398 RepID=A0A5J5ITF5_9MICO|nr:DUF2231 domain-containing protein [Microbacterium radiodurans]KAA9089237.1 DUF2231 domain-containing protein [Microbacterium radiodurans]